MQNKSTFLVLKYILSFTLFFLLTGLSASAQKERIRVIDQSDKTAINGLHFIYSDQSGVADNNGIIEINYIKGAQLTLTHVSYGRRELSDPQVLSAIQKGFFEFELIPVDLQPVSIVALRKGVAESKKIELNYLDRQHHDGGAILNFDPSIGTIRKSGSYGFDPVFRGFKYDQLNIVVDGAQGAMAACPNRMDPATSQVALNMIDHVEILKGPYSLRFGNSFGATINFVSADPEFPEKFKPYGRISSSWESNGNISRSEGFIGANNRNLNFKFFGSWSKGTNYKDGDGNIVPADIKRGSFGSLINYKLAENQLVSISATRNIGRDTDFPALPMDLRKDDTWMLNAKHSITFNERSLRSWKSMVYGTLVSHLMDNSLKILNPRTVNTSSPTETRTYGARTEGTWNLTSTLLYTGADLKIEEAEGFRYREMLAGPNAGRIFTDNSWQNSRISKGSIFTEAHINTGFLLLVFSGRLDVNTASTGNAATEFTGVNPETDITQLNPSVSLGGIRSINNKVALKLWLGRSQRSGSITERFINYFPVGMDPYELLGNPKLKPEANNQADLIFEFKTERTFLNIDVFASYMQDYISPVTDTALNPRMPSSPGVRQFQNIGSAFKTGFEISWKQALMRGLQHQVGIACTYGQSLDGTGPLPEIAPADLRYSLNGNYLKNKLYPEITLRHVLKQERVSAEFGEKETPAFTTLDLAITYKPFSIFHISGGVQNLFDATYYEHLNRGYNGNPSLHIHNPGRSFYIALNLNFDN